MWPMAMIFVFFCYVVHGLKMPQAAHIPYSSIQSMPLVCYSPPLILHPMHEHLY
jgi:hypothetical protein